jgi:beta-fructofuranosidase
MLIAFDQYLEFSLDGHIVLTLADNQFEQGKLGFYVESANIRVESLELKTCYESPAESYLSGVPE